jgi:hypothetical protein
VVSKYIVSAWDMFGNEIEPHVCFNKEQASEQVHQLIIAAIA